MADTRDVLPLETEKYSLVRSVGGAGPVAFVEFLSSPSNPVNCFRCNELRLVFRLDGYVLSFHKKPARMFMNAGSQTQLPVPFGSKQETGWSLQA